MSDQDILAVPGRIVAFLLATEGGFSQGPADFSAPFRPFSLPVPVHGMGVTVLEEVEPGLLLIGSFMGLYLWEEESGRVRRLPAASIHHRHLRLVLPAKETSRSLNAEQGNIVMRTAIPAKTAKTVDMNGHSIYSLR